MERIKKSKGLSRNTYILLLGIIIVSVGLYFYKNTSRFHENDKELPFVIPQEDIVFLEKCNLMEKMFDVPSGDFEIVEYKCSAQEKFRSKMLDGQELVVEIFTQNFNKGIDIFRDWLISQDFQESDKLRINYQHKTK